MRAKDIERQSKNQVIFRTFVTGVLIVSSIALCVLLNGCADSSTTGTMVEKEYDVKVTVHNTGGGTVNITPGFTVDQEDSSHVAQDTENESTLPLEVKTPVALSGATASGGDSADNENVYSSSETTENSDVTSPEPKTPETPAAETLDDASVNAPSDELTQTIPLVYNGNSNGNRPTYYTHKNRLNVGDKFAVECGVEKSATAEKRSNGSIGYDWPDGTVVKNSELSEHGIAVLIPTSFAGNPPKDCWVKL